MSHLHAFSVWIWLLKNIIKLQGKTNKRVVFWLCVWRHKNTGILNALCRTILANSVANKIFLQRRKPWKSCYLLQVTEVILSQWCELLNYSFQFSYFVAQMNGKIDIYYISLLFSTMSRCYDNPQFTTIAVELSLSIALLVSEFSIGSFGLLRWQG